MSEHDPEPLGEQPSSGEVALQFLNTQIATLTSHLQIADAKAAGVVAFISVLSGYTSTRVASGVAPICRLADWVAVSGTVAAFMCLAVAFAALVPRGWRGKDRGDAFSWVGLSSSAGARPYGERIKTLTHADMVHALADSVETTSLVVAMKYRLVAMSVLLALGATGLQIASWLLM